MAPRMMSVAWLASSVAGIARVTFPALSKTVAFTAVRLSEGFTMRSERTASGSVDGMTTTWSVIGEPARTSSRLEAKSPV